jgi:hypothetical protein
MKYDPGHKNILAAITYGSHLYGTSTPTSDHDFKAVTLPAYRDLILNKTLHVERYRFDVNGDPVGHQTPMGDNGYEAEHTPVQKFVHDYLGGQAYAVELVHAVMQGFHVKHAYGPMTPHFEALCETLAKDFLHKNVNGMVGFAVKQTFDYVRRGERLNAARAVMDVVEDLLDRWAAGGNDRFKVRLDTQWSNPPMMTVLDEIVARTGLEVGSSVNNNKVMRTLKLNGREYLETTTLIHVANAIEKLIDGYGERSTRASETDVDWKSLSHAVRVYQQVEELLQVGMITFPRPNAESLLRIRKGECKLESVRDLLRDLDDNTTTLIAQSKLPAADDVMRAEVDGMLVPWLLTAYHELY